MLSAFIDFLFPLTCVFCRKPLLLPEKRFSLCAGCLKKSNIFLQKDYPESALYPFAGITALGPYRDDLRNCLHTLKYKNKRSLAKPLGILLAQQVLFQIWPEPDAVVSIPLHPQRLRERGYNQSRLLAEEVCRYLNLPHQDILVRHKNTPPQAKLYRQERLSNIRGAFHCTTTLNSATSRILLIDDVLTTGATIKEAANTLICHGAESVYAAVVAH